MKRYVHSLHKISEKDQYVVQNQKWSGVHGRSNLSNTLLQEVLTSGPLTATGPEVFVTTMTTFFSNSDDALEENLTHM